MSQRKDPSKIIRQREFPMLKNTTNVAAIVMTGAILAVAIAPVQASGQLPIFKACLVKAETAQDPKAARDQCVWDHWDLMAEYN